MDGGPIQITSIVVVRPELPRPPKVEEIPGEASEQIESKPVALLSIPDEKGNNNEMSSDIDAKSILPKTYSATFEAETGPEPEPEKTESHNITEPDESLV